MNKPFEFKRFTIEQDKCAMKIGTDGVLLGAWTSVEENPDSVLDIGSGTGLLSLMIAQRSGAQTIDAIELDEKAHEQCVENFEASDWSDRLFCYHASFREFVDEVKEKYDLIVCNPPFFSEDVSSGNFSRDTARQNASLPFEELLEGVSKLLSANGSFSVIIPFKEEADFLNLAARKNLFTKKITRVKGNPSSEIKRSLLEFSFQKKEVLEKELFIEQARHQYTDEYISLTKDFYLKM